MGVVVRPELFVHKLQDWSLTRSNDTAIFGYQQVLAVEDETVHMIDHFGCAVVRELPLHFLATYRRQRLPEPIEVLDDRAQWLQGYALKASEKRLAVERAGHLFEDVDAPQVVLDQIVVGGED